MDLKYLKEELKGKILGFEVTKYLLETGTTRTEKQKEAMIQDSYSRLEKWIFENVANVKIEDEPEKEILEPDTNDPGLFPAEGSDLLDF